MRWQACLAASMSGHSISSVGCFFSRWAYPSAPKGVGSALALLHFAVGGIDVLVTLIEQAHAAGVLANPDQSHGSLLF